jgi:hypothetical protein
MGKINSIEELKNAFDVSPPKKPIKEALQEWIATFELPVTGLQNEKTVLILEKFQSFKNWASAEALRL